MSEKAEIINAIPFSPRRAIKLLAAVAAYVAIAYGFGPVDGLSHQGQCSIALMVAAVIIWVTDALPLAVAAILMTRHLQDNQGSLRLKGGSVQCFPGNANYILLYLTFLVSVLVQAVGLLLGPVPVLYAVEIVWLLAMAVYYTVRLM